jgi:hypothetical protein
VDQGLLTEWTRVSSLSKLHNHTLTHHTRQDSSVRVTSPTQRPLPDNTQHSQETDIHAPGGIRTHSATKRAAADPRLSPYGHRGLRVCFMPSFKNYLWDTVVISWHIYCAESRNFVVLPSASLVSLVFHFCLGLTEFFSAGLDRSR